MKNLILTFAFLTLVSCSQSSSSYQDDEIGLEKELCTFEELEQLVQSHSDVILNQDYTREFFDSYKDILVADAEGFCEYEITDDQDYIDEVVSTQWALYLHLVATSPGNQDLNKLARFRVYLGRVQKDTDAGIFKQIQ